MMYGMMGGKAKPKGWAIFNTVRKIWFKGPGEWTNKESEAHLWPTKEEAEQNTVPHYKDEQVQGVY